MTLKKYRALAVLSMAALGWGATGAPVQAGSPSAPQILIKDFMFSPMSLTVKAGSTVIWANKDDEPHTVVSDIGMVRSGAVNTDETFAFRFDKPGTYRFTCLIHPRMVGTIVVQ
jgi:plastocyanin